MPFKLQDPLSETQFKFLEFSSGNKSAMQRCSRMIFELKFQNSRFLLVLTMRRENFSLGGTSPRRGHVPFMNKFCCLGQLRPTSWVLLQDPQGGHCGVFIRCFDPLYVRICLRTIMTQFHLQTIPQNATRKKSTQQFNFDQFPDVLDICPPNTSKL